MCKWLVYGPYMVQWYVIPMQISVFFCDVESFVKLGKTHFAVVSHQKHLQPPNPMIENCDILVWSLEPPTLRKKGGFSPCLVMFLEVIRPKEASKCMMWTLNSWSQRFPWWKDVFKIYDPWIPVMKYERSLGSFPHIKLPSFLNAPHNVIGAGFCRSNFFKRQSNGANLRGKRQSAEDSAAPWSWEGTLIHLCNMWNFHSSWCHGLRGKMLCICKYDAAHLYI